MTGLLACAAQAVTYTWDGGSAVDSNWGSAENWNPDGAPVSASDTWVQFNGSTRLTPSQNIATPFVLNRLDFLGSPLATAFTVGGGQLQFVTNGVTQPRLFLDRNATCVITNAIEIQTGATLFAQIGTHGMELRGPVAGGGAIDKQSNAGGLSLNNNANTFSGGLTVRAQDSDWYKVNINASGAMGTGPVSLYGGTLSTGRTNPGGLIFYGTTTHTNPISLFANSPIFAAMPNGTAVVTLNTGIDLNTFTLHLRGGGAGTVGGVLSEGAANAITKSDSGTWTLNAANTFQGRVTLVNGTLRLGASGSLNPLVSVSFACATGFASTAHATFDMNGRSQAVSQLDGTTAQPFLTNILTSASAATLVVDQSASTVFNGRLAGALSFVKAGAGSLTLSNAPSATTGNITVSNGTLAVASGASLSASAGVTVAGGVLELRTAAAIADAASLSITDGAKVLLGGGEAETVDKLFINGAQQPRGYYGTSASGAMYADDAHFDGMGQLYVTSNPPITPTTVTWDADGADDTLLSTAANWVGDVLPLFDGATHAVFATGGITATVDFAANLYGLTFNRDGPFVLAAGAGVISNGMGGILASVPTAVARTYTLAEDLVLTDHQTWNAATNLAAATLNVTGSIGDSFLPCNVTKTGFGPLLLTGSNTFDGTLTISEGEVRIYHSAALGSTNGNTVVNGGAGGRLLLYGGLTLAEPLVLNGDLGGGTLVVGTGSNVISGPVTCYNQVRIQGYNGPLVFTGGVTAGDNNGLFVVNSGSVITFQDKPLNLGTRTFWSDSGGVSVLAVAGNTWADTVCAGGGIRCEVPNALPPTATMRLGIGTYRPDGKLDLNGNDQTVSKLYIGASLLGTRIVTSATPALLTVNQNDSTVFDGRFTGAVSLLKLGGGNLTLTNAFTTTSGSFAVSNGMLTVSATGTLGANSAAIHVGGGTLTLSNSVAIADSATVWMPAVGTSSAKINLAEGVNEKVGWLFFGDKMMRAGTYGSSSSPAAVKDNTHFEGTGVLTVLHDSSGTLIKLH